MGLANQTKFGGRTIKYVVLAIRTRCEFDNVKVWTNVTGTMYTIPSLLCVVDGAYKFLNTPPLKKTAVSCAETFGVVKKSDWLVNSSDNSIKRTQMLEPGGILSIRAGERYAILIDEWLPEVD